MGHGLTYRAGVAFLLFFCLILSASAEPTTKPSKGASASTKPTSKPANDKMVYVGKSGKKYHEEDCTLLHGTKIPMKLSEAVANGYSPCSKCEASKKAAVPAKKDAPAPTPKAAVDEPTYKGKPLSEWVKLTHDKDQDTRDGAFDALKKMLPDPKARAAITSTLGTEDILDIAPHTFVVAPQRTVHQLAMRLKQQIGKKNSGSVAAHVSVIMIDQPEEYKDLLQDLARRGLEAADTKDADGWRLLVDTIEKNHAGAAQADSSK